MNAPLQQHPDGAPVPLTSAYAALSPTERVVVDNIVRHFENEADRTYRPITAVLDQPIPHALIEQSHNFLQRERVQFAIRERVLEIAMNSEMTPDRLLREMNTLVMTSMADFTRMDGETRVFDFSKPTERQWGAVKKFKYKGSTPSNAQIDEYEQMLTGGRRMDPEIEIELYSRIDVIKMYAQIYGMMSDDAVQRRAATTNGSTPSIAPTASPEQAGEDYARFLENGS